MKTEKNKFIRWLLLGLGSVSLVLGLIGVFLPLLPTTPFVLLSAWCFLRASPQAHSWLRRQPLFGKALTDWEEKGAIARRTKWIAISTIFVSLVVIWLQVSLLSVKIAVSVLLITVSGFILSRPDE